jgi:hypothetical protein
MGWEFRFFLKDPAAALIAAAQSMVGAAPRCEERIDAYVKAGARVGVKVRSAAAGTDLKAAIIEIKVTEKFKECGAEKLSKCVVRGGPSFLRNLHEAIGAEWASVVTPAWDAFQVVRVKKQRWSGAIGEATIVCIEGSSEMWLSICVESGSKHSVISKGAALLQDLIAMQSPHCTVIVGGYAKWLDVASTRSSTLLVSDVATRNDESMRLSSASSSEACALHTAESVQSTSFSDTSRTASAAAAAVHIATGSAATAAPTIGGVHVAGAVGSAASTIDTLCSTTSTASGT